MERLELRDLLLGDSFKPRQEDIPTPLILLAKGVQENALRLVGMNGEQIIGINQAAQDNDVLRTALFVCHALRWRDGESTSVMAMSDANALITQDYELINALGLIVKPFLGLMPKAVTDAKNDSTATQNDDSGSGSPPPSEAAPSINSDEDSTTANL